MGSMRSAIAVHRAVDVDCRHALAVDVEDPVDIFRVCYIGGTLVVNDEVIAFTDVPINELPDIGSTVKIH